MRKTVLMLAGVALLGVSGCGADNEAEADKLQSKAGAVPKPEGGTKDAAPQAKSYEDYAKSKQGNPYAGSNYPGAKK